MHNFEVNRLLQQFKARFSLPSFCKCRPQLLHLPPDSYVDVYGLSGGLPSDVPRTISTISRLMDENGIRWCIVGDLLLVHYCVPKIMGDIEILVPLEGLGHAQEVLNAATEFCVPCRPGRSYYNQHLAQFSRFRVKGMNQCFFVVPGSHYGLSSNAFNDIMFPPHVGFPLLPLPHYVKGLASIVVTKGANDNFLSQIEFLIDGMDIDEGWCHNNLESLELELVLSLCTKSAKKARMGSHPKYEGNLTSYIHNESERQHNIGVVGRVLEDRNVEKQRSTLISNTENAPPEGMAPFSALQGAPPSSLANDTNANCAVTIQVMSDLHLEAYFRHPEGDSRPGYEVFDCTPSSPVLALLGDIGLTVQDGLFDFLQRQLSKYEKIFFVMGNHEFYRTSHGDAKARVTLFADQMRKMRSSDTFRGEFIFLDRTRYDLTDQVTILGCTLWSQIPHPAAEIVGRRLNDFNRIHQWSVESHNSAHLEDAEWLDLECAKIKAEEPNRRIVILTHYAPAIQGTSAPEHKNSLLNSGFATDMTIRSCWGQPVSIWAFGHTHFNCDFVWNNVRVVSNQRGYEGVEASRSRFSEDLVLYL